MFVFVCWRDSTPGEVGVLVDPLFSGPIPFWDGRDCRSAGIALVRSLAVHPEHKKTSSH